VEVCSVISTKNTKYKM